MSFNTYLQKEREINRYILFLSSKSRKKELDFDSNRTLETICNGSEFFRIISGNRYCLLGSFNDRKIDCPYLSNQKDENEFRICNYGVENGTRRINFAVKDNCNLALISLLFE